MGSVRSPLAVSRKWLRGDKGEPRFYRRGGILNEEGTPVVIDGYRISEDISQMDLEVLHRYLSRSYWSEGIPFETMCKAFRSSLCFGILTESGCQVGFARMITDSATFAYLADVFILEEHRGKGLSKWLMETILSHGDLQGLRRMMLATKDAHGLYEQFGFESLASPEKMMELLVSDIYEAK